MANKSAANVGRPARISHSDVARAALTIGLDKVTLKEIGHQLGVNHSSLYRHVQGRDDILFAAADLAFSSITLPTYCSSWRCHIETLANDIWDLYAQYPGLAELMRTMEKIPPMAIRLFSACCKHLEQYGFTPWDAVLVVDSVMDLTCDSSSGWYQLDKLGKDGHKLGESRRQSWNEQANQDPNTAMHINMFNQIMDAGSRDWWQRKMGLILNGAETLLPTCTRI